MREKRFSTSLLLLAFCSFLGTEDAEDAFLKQRYHAMGLERLVPDPTALLVIDEADRLKIAGR